MKTYSIELDVLSERKGLSLSISGSHSPMKGNKGSGEAEQKVFGVA